MVKLERAQAPLSCCQRLGLERAGRIASATPQNAGVANVGAILSSIYPSHKGRLEWPGEAIRADTASP
jgi:hypothetical protein